MSFQHGGSNNGSQKSCLDFCALTFDIRVIAWKSLSWLPLGLQNQWNIAKKKMKLSFWMTYIAKQDWYKFVNSV